MAIKNKLLHLYNNLNEKDMYPKKEVDEFVFTKFQEEVLGKIDRLNSLARKIDSSDLLTLDKATMSKTVRDEAFRLIKLLLVDASKGDKKNK